MKFSDLLRMSGSNLLRRKLRTALTVLGVVIGTASIVVMISLGLGLQKSSLEQIEQYGGLTTINVNTWGNYNSDSSQEELRIDDGVVETISKIPHVEFASPILSTYVLLKQGVYEGSLTVQGMTQEALQNMDMKVGEGTLPEADAPLSFFYGNQVITNFYNSKTNEGYWENSEAIDVDLMNQPVFVIFDTDAYYQSKNGGSGGDRSTPTTPPKKYIIPTCGMLAGGTDEYSENSYSVYADIDALKAELKKIFKNKVIPGQPTNKKGKPLNYIVYNSAEVFVDDMEHVAQVQKILADKGYQVNSQMDWLESSRQQSNMVQAVLGGIGAVSLFVAAIGIANTMMMSIYERTKEIGVMKVLGCDMGNIRSMFLIESGFIGFMGGVLGALLSYGVSIIVNRFVSMSDMMGMSGNLSRIPLWLAFAAIGFAIFVGMAAGFMPAMRAMKLSPLAAIRNE